MPDRQSWLAYLESQDKIGVRALSQVERLNRTDELITSDDLQFVAQQWTRYRHASPL